MGARRGRHERGGDHRNEHARAPGRHPRGAPDRAWTTTARRTMTRGRGGDITRFVARGTRDGAGTMIPPDNRDARARVGISAEPGSLTWIRDRIWANSLRSGLTVGSENAVQPRDGRTRDWNPTRVHRCARCNKNLPFEVPPGNVALADPGFLVRDGNFFAGDAPGVERKDVLQRVEEEKRGKSAAFLRPTAPAEGSARARRPRVRRATRRFRSRGRRAR